jgi:hypothetical protein
MGMPRSCLFAVCLLLAATRVSMAQDGGIGVKGGVEFASQQVSVDGSTTLGTWTAVVAGAFYTQPLGARLGVQVEGLYAPKGAKSSSFGIDSTLRIDYVEVPILARLRLGSGRRHYYVAGGAAPAFRLRARVRTPFAGAIEEIDVADQVERLDLGAAAGGGVVLGRLEIDARYTLGLRDVDADTTDEGRTRNRAVAVTAAWRF